MSLSNNNFKEKIERYIERYNKLLPLNEHLVQLVGDKKTIKLLDIGSGPFSITGQTLEGVDISITMADKTDFSEHWKFWNIKPLFPVEYQNMEALTYEDNTFDIVNCVNALDHTRNPREAIAEMKRVLKPTGWIYINCNLDQHTVSGKHHFWDAKEDGRFINETNSFDLKDLGFTIEFIDTPGMRRYKQVIARYQKI